MPLTNLSQRMYDNILQLCRAAPTLAPSCPLLARREATVSPLMPLPMTMASKSLGTSLARNPCFMTLSRLAVSVSIGLRDLWADVEKRLGEEDPKMIHNSLLSHCSIKTTKVRIAKSKMNHDEISAILK